MVSKLSGHTQNIKAIDMKRNAGGKVVLVSCSFDKTVRTWSSA